MVNVPPSTKQTWSRLLLLLHQLFLSIFHPFAREVFFRAGLFTTTGKPIANGIDTIVVGP
jgi:hypothetical protein